MRFFQIKFFIIISFMLLAQFSVAQIYADFVFSNVTCQGDTVFFTDNSSGSLINSWIWKFGNKQITAQNAKYVYDSSGVYTVQLKISDGTHFDSISKNITINKNPIINFLIDSVPFSSYSKRFRDNSQSDTTKKLFEWNFKDGSPLISTDKPYVLHKFPDKGVYKVHYKITDANGCTSDTIKNVNVKDEFVVPNVVTPNDDGVNDMFCITSNGRVAFSITIYTRWGNVIYKSETAQQICWDAHTPDGVKVQPGTYFYVIQFDGNADYEPKTGFFNVFY